MIDESEVLTLADPFHHVDKKAFQIPFVCGARNLGEALRRIDEGAAMIRTKGEAGTGNVVEAVRHIHQIQDEIALLQHLTAPRLKAWAKAERVPDALVREVRSLGRLPVVNFAAGGIATPCDAALCRMLGVDGVFVGCGDLQGRTAGAGRPGDRPGVGAPGGLRPPRAGLDGAGRADARSRHRDDALGRPPAEPGGSSGHPEVDGGAPGLTGHLRARRVSRTTTPTGRLLRPPRGWLYLSVAALPDRANRSGQPVLLPPFRRGGGACSRDLHRARSPGP